MSDWFKDKLENIDKKLDKQNDKITLLEVNYAKMAVDVQYHIKRTNILEKQLVPIRNKYQQLRGVIKFVGALFTTLSIVEAFIHLYLKL